MKRIVKTIGKRRIVEGDPNLVRNDEILLLNKSVDLVPITFIKNSGQQLLVSLTDSIGTRKVNIEIDRPLVANLNIIQSGKTTVIRGLIEKTALSKSETFTINFTICYDNKVFSTFAKVSYDTKFLIPLPHFEIGASITANIIES